MVGWWLVEETGGEEYKLVADVEEETDKSYRHQTQIQQQGGAQIQIALAGKYTICQFKRALLAKLVEDGIAAARTAAPYGRMKFAFYI